ncbi:MAG: metallophosphoesterase [Chloroflexi bacterium]|nr:metallophosphoesterase [Chloroflexota bacterium]MBM3172676.1 metallophosphoesterase [Chloroflexota bacterium]MBM3174512.1 metallophosphoesterase [Chloroflexota bacterium]MBM4449645.1 metallophosphoesterase [Chloroflexota bacterium]
MQIGLMADTHDRLDAVEAAVDFFNSRGISDVLHAGDLVSPFVVPKFATLNAKLHYVWGNNEGDREYITAKFKEIGIVPHGDFADLELHGLRVALLHGRHEAVVSSLVGSGSYDLVVRGHSHKAEIIDGKTKLINPGEVCGYLSGRKTVALFHLDGMRGEIVEI